MSNGSRSDTARQIICLVVVAVSAVAANVFGASLSQTDTGNIANRVFGDTVFFFPATYVFATIWPVIYLGIVGLAIHQVLPSQAANPRYRKGMVLLTVNLVLNAGWVVIFGLQLFTLSLVAIIPIVVTAVLAYARLGVARTPDASMPERVLTIPVSIYAAWLTVATVANVSLALVAGGWDGFGIAYETWGVIMIVVGIGLGAALLFIFRDPVFPAVYAYAYLGIVVRRASEVPSVVIAAAVGTGVFLVLFVLWLTLRRLSPPASAS